MWCILMCARGHDGHTHARARQRRPPTRSLIHTHPHPHPPTPVKKHNRRVWAVEQLITGGGGQDRTWGVAEFVRRTMCLTDADLDAEALKGLAAAHLVGGSCGCWV